MGQGKTWLNTKYFHEAIDAFKNGDIEYNNIKNSVQKTTNDLMNNWKGEGREQFEKDYNVIFQQLKDVGDILNDLYESIVDAEAKYIETDEAIGKKLES